MTIQNFFNLSAKKALITGCSPAVGEAITIASASAGADIVGISESEITDSTGEKKVTALGRKFFSYKIDLFVRQEIYDTLKSNDAASRQIRKWLNNVGVIGRNPAASHSDEGWNAVLSINLGAVFIQARDLGKKMISRGFGKLCLPVHCFHSRAALMHPVRLQARVHWVGW